MVSDTVIRLAGPNDVGAIVSLVQDLAEYERGADQVQLTAELLDDALFGPDAIANCHVAELDHTVVGMALWYRSFSTWTGRTGLYLEDLFVHPDHRGGGCGRALLGALARVCRDAGWPRLEWAVLDWNSPAQGFYRALGAAPMQDWTVWRLDGTDLRALADQS